VTNAFAKQLLSYKKVSFSIGPSILFGPAFLCPHVRVSFVVQGRILLHIFAYFAKPDFLF